MTARGTLCKIDDGGSRKGSKGNAVRVLGGTLYRGCPRNCKRRVFGRHDHWDVEILGRWPNTATREPGHLPPATSHARTRWAGCPGVNVRVRPLRGCCPGRMAERATAKIAGDRLRFRRWGVAMLPVINSGRMRDRVPALRSLLISTSALTAVALLAAEPRPRANGAAASASRAKSRQPSSGPNRSAAQEAAGEGQETRRPIVDDARAAVARGGTVGQPSAGGDSHDAAQRRRRKRNPVGAACHRNTGFRRHRHQADDAGARLPHHHRHRARRGRRVGRRFRRRAGRFFDAGFFGSARSTSPTTEFRPAPRTSRRAGWTPPISSRSSSSKVRRR